MEVTPNPVMALAGQPDSTVERHGALSPAERARCESYACKFDVEGKGCVDELERMMMKCARSRPPATCLTLIRRRHRYDSTGSGTFSTAEVKAIVHDLETAKTQTKQLRKLTGGLVGLLFAFSGIMLAAVMAGVEVRGPPTEDNHADV